MRTSGQKPKPTRLKILEGDRAGRGKKKLQEKLESEPKPEKGLGECPKHLRGRARTMWKVWSEQLSIANMDRKPDAAALEGACQAFARACAADAILEAEGIVCRRKVRDRASGELVENIWKHPCVAIADREWTRVRNFCDMFGFSPAARSRISVPKDPLDDEAELMAILSSPIESKVGPIQ